VDYYTDESFEPPAPALKQKGIYSARNTRRVLRIFLA